MKRFVEGENRQQMILLPDCLDDYVVEDNPVRVIDVFIDELDLAALGFEGMLPATMGRPAYHPATLLKIYLYGYLNRIPSSRSSSPVRPRSFRELLTTNSQSGILASATRRTASARSRWLLTMAKNATTPLLKRPILANTQSPDTCTFI